MVGKDRPEVHAPAWRETTPWQQRCVWGFPKAAWCAARASSALPRHARRLRPTTQAKTHRNEGDTDMAATSGSGQGRVALITGGMGGLGETIATKMVDAGYKVVVTYSPGNTKYKEWIAGMKDDGYDILAVQCDVADIDSCTRAVGDVQDKTGAIDILVNNAGITRDMTFKKMDKVNWDAVMRTNLDSLFNMSKQVVDGMVERNWGRVVNVSSVNGSKGAFGQTNYSAAKAGVHGFTKALALEVAKKGVTVNTISPGYIGTKMVTAIPEDILNTKILPQIPVGRLGKPEEVAGLIIYLASEEAAFLTGANIAINGGQHMQ
jgi:acetoacetyl-CoA reductase